MSKAGFPAFSFGRFAPFALLLALLPGAPRAAAQEAAPLSGRPATFCNPVDLGYRFQLKEASRREAADPTMVRFRDEFWLFPSKSGGYWHSKDMGHWQFVAPTGLPVEDYAPAVAVIQGKMYYTAASSKALYVTDDPVKGVWTKAADIGDYGDPDLFVDDDGKVYMFSGCSPKDPIWGVELDPANHFAEVGQKVGLLNVDELRHGWETKNLLASDDEIKTSHKHPYLEGSWMTKRNGLYYLQYAAPGTEMKEYADGVYVSEHPLGPYAYAPYNPWSYKPTGFIGGAGHSSTFQDGKGNWWHISTMLVGVRHVFERRIGIFPAGFLPNAPGPDQLVCDTYLGDYPQFLPGAVADPLKGNSPGWMLLSYKKPATASSSRDPHPPELAFNEDVRNWWSAATGNPGEWLSVDLGKPCRIDAMQLNFADEGSTQFDRLQNDAYRYVVEVSGDGKAWTPCIDRKDNTRDAPHEYVQLDQPVTARYVRITNVHTPAGAAFSLSGFRVFGSGLGKPPAKVDGVFAQRLPNRRLARVAWTKVPGADFYIVRYGIAPGRLTLNVQVYDGESAALNGLNTDSDYYATVDAVNDSGVTRGTGAVQFVAPSP